MARTTQGARSLRTDAAKLLERCVGTRCRSASRQITHFLDRELAVSGLSLAQIGLLAHVATASDDRIGEIAERMGLDPSTLSRNLRILENAGLVEIAVVERDLRRRAVWLTEQGARRLEAALPLWRKASQKLSAQLDVNLVHRLVEATLAVTRGRLHTAPIKQPTG